jgi:hypothetical protein
MGSPTPAAAMSESAEKEGRRAGHQDRQQWGPSVKGTGVARDSEAGCPEEGMSPRLGGRARRWEARTAEYVDWSVAHSCARPTSNGCEFGWGFELPEGGQIGTRARDGRRLRLDSDDERLA